VNVATKVDDDVYWCAVALVAIDYAFEQVSKRTKSVDLEKIKDSKSQRPVTMARVGTAKAMLRGENYPAPLPKAPRVWLQELRPSISAELIPLLSANPQIADLLNATYNAAIDPDMRKSFDKEKLSLIQNHAGKSKKTAAEGHSNAPQFYADLFVDGVPPTRESSAAAKSKAQLYGGHSHLPFTALEFVTLGHHFRRSTVEHFIQRIELQTDRCCTFTLKSVPGGGLTMGLAQLVQAVDAIPNTRVFSILGSSASTATALETLSRPRGAELASWLLSETGRIERVCIVIDDVSSATMEQRGNLDRFISEVEKNCQESVTPQIIFVFGSHTHDLGHDRHGEFELELTQQDCYSCYDAMTFNEPPIIEGYPDGLMGLFTDHRPGRNLKSVFGNDIQALIDFMLEYGSPINETREYWLANIDGLTDNRDDPLRLVAVAQLLGLSIPQKLVSVLFNKPELSSAACFREFVEADARFQIVNGEWQGVGLSSARRARSILLRAKRLTPKVILDDFDILIQKSMFQIQKKSSTHQDAGEFVRHIFQRLGNRNNYLIWNGKESRQYKFYIGQILIYKYLLLLKNISISHSDFDTAKWAGAISIFTRNVDHGKPEISENLKTKHIKEIFVFIEYLLDRYFSNVNSGALEILPIDSVPVMKAARQVVRMRKVDKAAERIVQQIEDFFSFDQIVALVKVQLSQEVDDMPRRVNELIHAHCKVISAIPAQAMPSKKHKRNAAILRHLCCLIQKSGVEPDAGTWIARARMVPDSQRVAINQIRWNFYMQKAQKCIEDNPLTQATWQADLGKAFEQMPVFPSQGVSDA
jgi:hypothetical protein